MIYKQTPDNAFDPELRGQVEVDAIQGGSETNPLWVSKISNSTFQKALEVLASETGGGKQQAPGQRVTDFLKNRLSKDLPTTSYRPGILSAPLHEMLPRFISKR